jgi:hypothetical protein
MSLSEEAEKDDSCCPDVDSAGLVGVVEECLRRHVSLGASPILDLHVLLELYNLLNLLVVSQFAGLALGVVHLNLGKAEVNEEARVGLWIVQKVGWLDVAMHDPFLSEMLHCRQQRVHVVFDFFETQFRQIGQERLTLLVFENEGDLPVQAKPLDQIRHILLPVAQLQNQHLNQDESRVDRRENPLYRVSPPLPLLVRVTLVVSKRLEYDSIGTYQKSLSAISKLPNSSYLCQFPF